MWIMSICMWSHLSQIQSPWKKALVKRAVKSVAQGAGIRAVAGERTGFAYSDDLSVRDLVASSRDSQIHRRVTAG